MAAQGNGLESRLPGGQLAEGQGDHVRVAVAGSPDQGDHRGRRLGRERLRLLTGGPHFRVAEHGMDDEGIVELMAVVDLFAGLNKLMDGFQVEPDEKPWYG